MKFEIFLIVFYFLYYRTALHIAIENKNLEMVKLLLSNKNCDISIGSILTILLILFIIEIN